MRCEKCDKNMAPGMEELNLPSGFRLEISQEHGKVEAKCNRCHSVLRTFQESPVIVEKLVEKAPKKTLKLKG